MKSTDIYHVYYLLNVHCFHLYSQCLFFVFFVLLHTCVRLKPKPTPSPPPNTGCFFPPIFKHGYYFRVIKDYAFWGRKVDGNSHTLCILHASGRRRLQEIKSSNILCLKGQMEFEPGLSVLFILHNAFQHLVQQLPAQYTKKAPRTFLSNQNVVFADLKLFGCCLS